MKWPNGCAKIKVKPKVFGSDLYQWFKAIIHHWVAIAGGALVAVVFQIWSGIWRHDWLPVLT
jgi:putative effector of murein hydrolase